MSTPRSWLAAIFVLLTGCFEETFAGDNGNTTDGPCVQGMLGCECYGNASCDAGLACDTAANKCIPEGCTPGELSCSCDDTGACMSPLECSEGICISPGAPPATSTADGTSTTSGMPTAEDTTTTSDPPDTTTSEVTTATSETDVGETDVPDCDAMTCEPCLGCADQLASECADELATCNGITGCNVMAQCLQDCGLTGLCFRMCCDSMSMEAIDAAFALTVCRTDACITACSDFEFPTACP